MISLANINMVNCGNVNCYVIRGSKGDILIDTGMERYRDHIETWLQNYDIRLIILTHGHADHVQNAGYFSRLYNAPIMISPYDLRLARDNSCRPYYITNPLGKLMKRQLELNLHIKMNHFEPSIFAEDGMDLSPYGIDGIIIDLQGHTRGSIGVLCKSVAGFDLYCGDALTGGPVPCYPITCESPKSERRTIEKIVTLSPDRLFAGHGSPICIGEQPHKFFIDRF